MRRASRSAGYAMLAALLVAVLAATFALVAVAAVHAVQVVERSDASAWRAAALGERGLSAVSAALRRQPAVMAGSVEGEEGAGAGWRADWSPAPPIAGVAEPRLDVLVEGASGAARRRERLTLEVRTEPWATGVTCAGDAEITGELVVSGSGVYVGGCLRGREHVRFTPDTGAVTGDGRPADGVRGSVFPAAAVHGGAGIYARGAEIHEAGAGGEFPDDTDRHAGTPAPSGWVRGPTAGFMAAAEAGAPPAAPWMRDGTLRLNDLPPAPGGTPGEGRCFLLPVIDEVGIEGSLPPSAGRVLLVARGDAVVGQPGEVVRLTGGLVVPGRLSVRGDLVLAGSLHAGALEVTTRARLVVPPEWRAQPLPWAAAPVVVERGS